MTIFSDHVFF